MPAPICNYWVNQYSRLSLGFCIIWSFFSESDNMPSVKTPNLEGDCEKGKGGLNHNCISVHNQLWFLMSLLCTAFSATSWRSSNPCPLLGQVENIAAINFNFLELVRIQKMYFEGKVNKQQACNREGSSRVKSWPLLTFGDKGLGVATIFRWHRGIWSRTWLWVFQE